MRDVLERPQPERTSTDAGAGWLAETAGRIAGLRGWRRYSAALAAGSVSVLSMAPFFAAPVLFVTLPLLVWLIDGPAEPAADRSNVRRSAGPAFAAGWWFGFGYHLFGLYWIGAAFLVEAEKFAWALPFAITLLPAGLALFFGLAAVVAERLSGPGLRRVLALALALTAAEWLRGHILTGFPWNALGYALTFPLPLMQTAALAGVYGLTPWVVLIAAGPLVLWADAAGKSWRWLGPALAAVPLAAAFGYGTLRLAEPPPPAVDGVRLRMVQPSIRQREKWRPENQRSIFQDHLDLSQTNPDGKRDGLAGVTHVVWPEAAMPFLPLNSPFALEAIGRLLPAGSYLLAGGLRVEEDVRSRGRRQVFNSVMVFGQGGKLTALYDKIHLVPFGEYLPLLQSTLESLGFEQLARRSGGFSSGAAPRQVLHAAGLPPFGVLICYEAIFPGQIVHQEERPDMLVNVTNDGWFGTTSGPHQHFHQARVRAVEEGLPLLRAANNGISAIIDPYGRVWARLPLDARGVIDSGLPGIAPQPLYSRFGDTILLVEMIVLSSISASLTVFARYRSAGAGDRGEM